MEIWHSLLLSRTKFLSMEIIYINTPSKPKKKRYVCKYLNSWEKEAEFQGWLTKSVKGEDHAFCRLCMKNIKIPILSKIAQSMCCIPNSNADYERVFSLVRKIQTEQRASMDNQTLCSFLCAKMNCKEECHQVKPSKDTLKLTKSAAYNYNKEH